MSISPELLATWKPRRITVPGCARPVVDVLHSAELVAALTAEFLALGFDRPVASMAAASVVNMQMVENFDLTGSHQRDGFLASQALSAIKVWADAQAVALRKAA